MANILQDKVVLVIGGTGSMGKILVERLLTNELGQPEKIIVFSRDEAKLHAMQMRYLHRKVVAEEGINNNCFNLLAFQLGDIRNYDDVCRIIKNVDIIINAAALKQVPFCEYFPHQAIMTNCLGAYNVVRAIQQHHYPIETVCGISTDKACKPVNVMGMTKAIHERIFTSANVYNPKTRFIMVRYGNVLASRGSVIPLFKNQILHGGPVTLTLPHMTRFLLSLHDAVNTVFAALVHAKPGETYIPIAPSATVENIAKALIGDRNISIIAQGIRPGEKIHEILVSEEEMTHCIKANGHYVILPMLPELHAQQECTKALQAEFSSADNILSLQDTIALLGKNNLLQPEQETEGELLR